MGTEDRVGLVEHQQRLMAPTDRRDGGDVEGVTRTRTADDRLELHVQGADRLVPRIVLVAERGGFDLLAEVVCEGTEELLALLNDVIRSTPGVTTADAFTYLHLQKQTYSWGTR